MIVVHIGLGKTATTSLQNSVFPKISKLRPNITYNHQTVRKLLIKSTYFNLNDEELAVLKEELSTSDHFLSLESLVNWNPRFWETAADANLKLFGPDAQIIITVREPESYLTSLYQQTVHVGNVKEPELFFVSGEQYDELKKSVVSSKLELFDVDSFDLERLETIYKRRFKSVTVASTSMLSEMGFLRRIFKLNGSEIEELSHAFKSSPRSNRAYSMFGMWLTFAREGLLNRFGLQSFQSNNRDLVKLHRSFKSRPTPKDDTEKPYRSLSLSGKIIQAPWRLVRRLNKIISWRQFIQGIIDKVIPYRKYVLPNSIYLNDALLDKNRRYLHLLSIAENEN